MNFAASSCSLIMAAFISHANSVELTQYANMYTMGNGPIT